MQRIAAGGCGQREEPRWKKNRGDKRSGRDTLPFQWKMDETGSLPIGSMYAMYGNIM
jgi:hypothetical protein